MTFDLRRRGFIFGVSALLILPPVRTFHFLPRRRIETLAELYAEYPDLEKPGYQLMPEVLSKIQRDGWRVW
jgi:hypothetical protein